MDDPLVGRLRRSSTGGGTPQAERLVVVLESLLPDPDQSLERLLASQRAEGAKLDRHWRLTARDAGHGAREVGFEPARGEGQDPSLLASGLFGTTRVEISLLLAHANPAEQEGLRGAMRKGMPFKLIVLSHEVDVE